MDIVERVRRGAGQGSDPGKYQLWALLADAHGRLAVRAVAPAAASPSTTVTTTAALLGALRVRSVGTTPRHARRTGRPGSHPPRSLSARRRSSAAGVRGAVTDIGATRGGSVCTVCDCKAAGIGVAAVDMALGRAMTTASQRWSSRASVSSPAWYRSLTSVAEQDPQIMITDGHPVSVPLRLARCDHRGRRRPDNLAVRIHLWPVHSAFSAVASLFLQRTGLSLSGGCPHPIVAFLAPLDMAAARVRRAS